MTPSVRRLLLPAGMWYLAGTLEGVEALRQRRRSGAGRSRLASPADRDPASLRLLTLTWWPAGAVALAEAAVLPRLSAGRKWDRHWLIAGIAVTGTGIVLRQWAIRTLGQHFVRHVLVQPGQTVVSSGPYRWLRHPSYTGLWLEMTGVGLSTGNAASLATCALVPLAGITARINGEERELTASLPGYREYIQGKPRLVPHLW
ncbi:MAG: isoprenylcysteine carboxylmethyltransferase family protein [Streptosporangiaceae bacterium]|nr:isoprenylcysteine carboxylmethyltransferase family protein [Streptosporangiaceae bacterium]